MCAVMVVAPSRADTAPERPAGRFGPWSGTVCATDGGELLAHDVRVGEELVMIVVPVAGTVALTTEAAEEILSEGALVVVDGRQPFVLTPVSACELALVTLPRPLLTETDPAFRRMAGRALDAERSTGALLASAVRALCHTPGSDTATVDWATHHMADLVSTLIAELDQDPEPARENGLMAEIRWYVNCHLGDPGLSPESIAAAHYVSVRYLHKLFEGEGTTVSRWIQRRRLHECRRELGRAGHGTVTIASVAQRWGFANAAHFSRAFRAVFGVSPRDWRDARTPSTRGWGTDDAGGGLELRRCRLGAGNGTDHRGEGGDT